MFESNAFIRILSGRYRGAGQATEPPEIDCILRTGYSNLKFAFNKF